MDKVRKIHEERRNVYEILRKNGIKRKKAAWQKRIRRSRYNGNYGWIMPMWRGRKCKISVREKRKKFISL